MISQLVKSGDILIHQEFTITRITDDRGTLDFLDLDDGFPFIPKRFFTLKPSSEGQSRGNHAHKKCHQFLVVVVGRCTLEIKNKSNKIEINLEAGHRGVWVKPMNWVTLSNFSDDCCILVLASDSFDPSDYINNFEELETDLMIERSKSEQ